MSRKLISCIVFLVTFSVPLWADSASPFSGKPINVGNSGSVAIPTFEEANDYGSEPVIIEADPLASATQPAKDAHNTIEDILTQIENALEAGDYKKAAEGTTYLDKISKDVKSGKTVKPGLFTTMRKGGVAVSKVNELEGRFAQLKSELYAKACANMTSAARKFEGYKTSSGPGGGDVACAWLMSKVLAAAGMVPQGWMETGALNLTRRLVKEFGWTKVPSNGNPDSGSMKSSAMKPGDIVFWSPSDHVGVYLGGGMCMSNSSSTHRGTIHPVSGYYSGWVPRYVVRPPGNA